MNPDVFSAFKLFSTDTGKSYPLALPLWDFQNLSGGLSYRPNRGFFLQAGNRGFVPKSGGLSEDPLRGGSIDGGRTYLRGLHFQSATSTGGLTTATFGRGLLVVTDNRRGLALRGLIQPGGQIQVDAFGNARAALTFLPHGGWLTPDFQAGMLVPLAFNFTVPLRRDVWWTRFNTAVNGKVGTTPEPGTLLLFSTGLVGLCVRTWRRRVRS